MDLLAVQGTLKSLLQHHSWKASILWHLTFFMVQLSHPYVTTGKTMALTIRAFVGKVMSLTKSEPNWKVTDSFQNPPAHLLRVKCCTLSVCGHGRSYSLRGFQLYGPTLTSIHDYWENHSFDYMDVYWQSTVSAF